MKKKTAKKIARRKFGYEAGDLVPVLMTASDRQRIKDIDNGIAMLLDGTHLEGLSSEIASIREDIDRIETVLDLLARKIGAR